MIKLLKTLLEKWTCRHKWITLSKQGDPSDSYYRGSILGVTFCPKCRKTKQVKLKKQAKNL